jgi:hypothetical protein
MQTNTTLYNPDGKRAAGVSPPTAQIILNHEKYNRYASTTLLHGTKTYHQIR